MPSFGVLQMLDRPAGSFLISNVDGITTLSVCAVDSPSAPGSHKTTPPGSVKGFSNTAPHSPSASCGKAVVTADCSGHSNSDCHKAGDQQQGGVNVSAVHVMQDSAYGSCGGDGRAHIGDTSRHEAAAADDDGAAVVGGVAVPCGCVERACIGDRQLVPGVTEDMSLISFRYRDVADGAGLEQEAAEGVKRQQQWQEQEGTGGGRTCRDGPSFTFSTSSGSHGRDSPQKPTGQRSHNQQQQQQQGRLSKALRAPSECLLEAGASETASSPLPISPFAAAAAAAAPSLPAVRTSSNPYLCFKRDSGCSTDSGAGLRRGSSRLQAQMQQLSGRSDSAASRGSGPQRMVSLTTGTLRRMSVDSGMFGGAVGLPMQLRQGAQGMLNAVVPAGVWGAGDQGPPEVVEAVEGEDMAGRSQSSIIKRREAAMLVKFLEQANEEREYEVSALHVLPSACTWASLPSVVWLHD